MLLYWYCCFVTITSAQRLVTMMVSPNSGAAAENNRSVALGDCVFARLIAMAVRRAAESPSLGLQEVAVTIGRVSLIEHEDGFQS